MISKSKLFSIGKLSIATLLLLATSMQTAKAAIDPAAPSDTSTAFLTNGNGISYVQFNWIDNALNETKFQLIVSKISGQNIIGTDRFDIAPSPNRGLRLNADIKGYSSGLYKYSVCTQLPTKRVCSVEKTFQIAQAPVVNFSAPTNVSATRVGASTERIFWNHPGGADSFRVYIRLPGANNWSQAATVGGNERRADIAPLLINTNYLVAVCGRSPAGQEQCSPAINVILPQNF
jgi:hypothetical protein